MAHFQISEKLQLEHLLFMAKGYQEKLLLNTLLHFV